MVRAGSQGSDPIGAGKSGMLGRGVDGQHAVARLPEFGLSASRNAGLWPGAQLGGTRDPGCRGATETLLAPRACVTKCT